MQPPDFKKFMRQRFAAATIALIAVIAAQAGIGWWQIGKARSEAHRSAILHSIGQYVGLVGSEGFRVAYDPDPDEREEAREILSIALGQLAELYIRLSGTADGFPDIPEIKEDELEARAGAGVETATRTGERAGALGSENAADGPLAAKRAEATAQYRAAPLPTFFASDREHGRLRTLWDGPVPPLEPSSGSGTAAKNEPGLRVQIARLAELGASLLDPGAMQPDELAAAGREIEILSVLEINPKLNRASVAFERESERILARLKVLGAISVLTMLAAVITSLFGILLPMERRVTAAQVSLEKANIGLEKRVSELSSLLAQNEELRGRVQRASRRIAEVNEQYLRRVGADLHDGPAQLLALAALRLDSLKPLLAERPSGSGGRSDIEVVRESLTDALSDIRDICTGLTLPELDDLSPRQLLVDAAQAHERPSATTVDVDIQSAPDNLDKSTKICLYRFVQETLSNASRHAGGIGQRLSCRFDGETLEVAVSDTGPGFDPSTKTEVAHGLGLPGLRERIESIGGILQIDSAPGKGTRVVLRCTVAT